MFRQGAGLLGPVDTAAEPKALLSRRVLFGSMPVFVLEPAS